MNLRSARLTRTATDQGGGFARRHKPDYWLLILMAIMMVIGIVVVYAISPALSSAANTSPLQYVSKQLLAVGISLAACIFLARLPLDTIKKLSMALLGLAAAATVIALITPTNPHYPAHRWVRLGSFSFQSVELVKFAVMVWLASLLSERMRLGKINDVTETLKPIGIALAIIGVIVAGVQSDLGSAGVLVVMMATMVFVAGMPMRRLLLIAAGVAVAVVLLVTSTPYRRDRLETYLHPEKDCSAAGYQACQALIAVGSGGISGLGLGRSVQAYGYLPEASNDSIFAIYAEKFGFIGVMLLLAIMIGFFSRMKKIAERAPDDFSRLLVMAVLSWLSVQAFVNIGAMIGLLPLKGITLPFISSGGTSIVFAAAAVGIVFQISYYTLLRTPSVRDDRRGLNEREGRYDDSRDGRRQRGAYHPNSGSRA